jgi:AraC-like DNA-binding protein
MAYEVSRFLRRNYFGMGSRDLLDCAWRVVPMLQTKMAPSSAVLRPYVWAYGMTTGRVGSVPLVIPLPARPKQLLTFSFADSYRIHRPGSDHSDASPRVTVVGPQTHARVGLSVFGRIDNFTIHFQPSGFNRLFGIPMTELTDAAYDAYNVIGPKISRLEDELGDTPDFAERIQLIEERLIRMFRCGDTLDPVAIAANSLFASNGIHRISAMANDSGLSPRQFERRFLAQVGVPPKLYARIIRFNAALDHKLRWPSRAWSRIANDHDFYDQMHLVHDFRAFTGESPARFLAHLDGVPEFHTFFATGNRPRHE